MLGAVFAAFVGLAAARCASPNTTCTISEYSVCVETCSMYPNTDLCTQANCTWANERCEDPNNITGTCSNATTSTDCDTLSTNCTWKTVYCKPETYCAGSDGTYCATGPDGECPTNQGPHCEKVGYCSEVGRCEIPSNQTECTETPGCFWHEGTSTAFGKTQNISQCSACFPAFGDDTNQFYYMRNMIGLTCGGFFTIEITLAVAASTGCSGGQTPPFSGCTSRAPTTGAPTTSTPTSSPTTNTPTSSPTTSTPTTSTPTSSPTTNTPTTSTPTTNTPTTSTPTTLAPSVSTGAPTDSTINGAVARGAVGLMATLLGTFLLA